MEKRTFGPPKRKRAFPRVCPICGGPIKKAKVTLSFPDGEQVKVVRGVPAGVCASCGEEYLTAQVSEALQRILATPPHERVTTPVWKYASNL